MINISLQIVKISLQKHNFPNFHIISMHCSAGIPGKPLHRYTTCRGLQIPKIDPH